LTPAVDIKATTPDINHRRAHAALYDSSIVVIPRLLFIEITVGLKNGERRFLRADPTLLTTRMRIELDFN
jgi:hypothetical protein